MIDHPLWNVPYRQNPFFTGREDLLAALRQGLQAESTVALCHPLGISGLGGIGKTQAALEYVYRYSTNYTAVFWIRADSIPSLIESFVALANQLDLPERNEQDQRLIVEAVSRWLRLKSGWLLVFDNLENLQVVEPFLPKAGAGHILFTTRAHALGGIAQRLEVKKMEQETAALLLLRRARIVALQSTLETTNQDHRAVARDIAQELDGLPLALDQAGAYIGQYIKETSGEALSALQEYLNRYQTRRREQALLHLRGGGDENDPTRDYPASVVTTWSLSFEKVAQAQPASAELLDFCAFVAPDAIPEEMISGGASHVGPLLQPVVSDPISFDRAIEPLLAYSLVDRNGEKSVLSIHRLVQAVLQDALEEEQRRTWAERVMFVVNAAFPRAEHSTWAQCERVLAHALVSARYIDAYHMVSEETGRLLFETASYLRDRARYAEAEPLFQCALQIREQQFGPEHPEVAASLNDLAMLYITESKYIEAEPLLQRALQMREQQVGSEHPDMATSLNNLAMLYFMQSKYVEAEPLLQRALAIWEQQLGPAHPDLARSLYNVAMFYYRQGNFVEAEALYRRALAIWEQQTGPEHPDAAYLLTALANLYSEQGKYAEAEPLYWRALNIWEQQLGSDHPDVAFSLHNLAMLSFEQGKYVEAEPLYQRALNIWEQKLGPEHPYVAYPLIGLANLHRERGEYTEAEPLYQRALRIREQALGSEHSLVADSLVGLANLYRERGEYMEAEPLYQRALRIQEQALGSEHPQLAEAIYNFARLREAQGNHQEASTWYARALKVYEQLLGARHPKATETRKRFVALLHTMGQHEKATDLEAAEFEP